MIKAVIFDLDGLLVDSEPLWFRARSELFQRFNLVWTDDDQERLMGVSTSFWIEYMSEKLQRKISSKVIEEGILNKMVSYYHAGDVTLMPGAQNALEFCYSRYKLGLASGSPRKLIEAALTGANWSRYFAEVLSSDEVAKGKPAPDVYLEVIRRLGIPASETVVVEDSGSGVLAGHTAGTKVVAVPDEHLKPSPDTVDKAHVVIDSLVSFDSALIGIDE